MRGGGLPVVGEMEEVRVMEGEAGAGGGEGGDERGGHEAVEEVELLGAGDAGPPREAEGQRVARDRARRALHRRRGLHVKLPPPFPVRQPSHLPQHRRRRRFRRAALCLFLGIVRSLCAASECCCSCCGASRG